MRLETFVYGCVNASYYMTQSLSREAESSLAARDCSRCLRNGKIQWKGQKSIPQDTNQATSI